MKSLILSLLSASMLIGCATTHPTYNAQQFNNEVYQKNVANALEYADNFIDFDQNNIPQAQLSTEDFSTLLNADIAFNQGDYAKPADSYYYLANKYQDPRLIYKGIICYEHIGSGPEQYTKLNQLINQLIKVAPNSKLARLFGIRVALEDNDLDSAKNDLKIIMKSDPTKSRAVLLFLSTVISNDINENAKANLQTFTQFVTDKYGQFPEADLFAVVSYSIAGDESGLLNYLDLTHAKYPNWEVPVYWSAGILSKMNNLPLLQAVMQNEIKLIKHPSSNLQNLYIAAMVRSNQTLLAESYVKNQLAIESNNSNALVNAAIVQYKLGNYKAALQPLAQAEQNKYALDGAVPLALAAVYDLNGQPESATLSYQRALQSNKILAPAANLGLLRIYIAQQQNAQADAFIDRMATENKLGPREAAGFKISIYTELGAYELAYQVAHSKIKQYSFDKQFIYYYASLAGITGRTQQAIRWYKEYIKVNPRDSAGYNDLGFLLADKTTKYNEAVKLANQAYQMSPKDPAILDTMGWVNYKLKNYTQAIPYLEAAYQQTQDHDTAQHLQQAYLAVGDKVKAAQVVVLDKKSEQIEFEQTMVNQTMLILMYYQYGMDLSQ